MTQACTVKFADGTQCTRRLHDRRGWCLPCYKWARRNGADPNGRPKGSPGRKRTAELQAAATATTDDCVIMTGQKGRPVARLGGEAMLASRAVWIIANGDPGDRYVLHTCHRGDEGCINIRHLYLGDHVQNIDDMAKAGRGRSGKSLLTDDQVGEVRARYRPGNRWRGPGNAVALGAEYGISPVTVQDIANGARRQRVT